MAWNPPAADRPGSTRRQFCRWAGGVMAAAGTVWPAQAAPASGGVPQLLHPLHRHRTVTALALGGDGRVYGVCRDGRHATRGMVFRLDADGRLVSLHRMHFKRGGGPVGLTWDAAGAFHGSTAGDGAHGGGTLFRIEPSGRFRHLHDFQRGADSGAHPSASLTRSVVDGHFYGSARFGGPADAGGVFRMTPGGRVEWLHFFDPAQDEGDQPVGPLTEASDGRWYGTTLYGGRHRHGTVFSMHRNGRLRTLHHFDHLGADGYCPTTGVTEGPDGHLYGVAEGHRLNRRGLIYRLPKDGPLHIIHGFPPGRPGHAHRPLQPLSLGRDGALYGSTSEGGLDGNFGTLFRFTLRGQMSLLHAFGENDPVGWLPASPLLERADGEFIGVTSAGSAGGAGGLYRFGLA